MCKHLAVVVNDSFLLSSAFRSPIIGADLIDSTRIANHFYSSQDEHIKAEAVTPASPTCSPSVP